MGVQNKTKNSFGGRSSSKSPNVYLNFLIKIYRFLAKKNNSKFNQVVLKRLLMSRRNQASISLSGIVRYGMKERKKIIVIVGKVLNDERISIIPQLSLCALKISESAKQRIIEAGGNIFTFDKFAMKFPTGKNSVLLRGSKICTKKIKRQKKK
jgi:large subunit ribosomal protein L18e